MQDWHSYVGWFYGLSPDEQQRQWALLTDEQRAAFEQARNTPGGRIAAPAAHQSRSASVSLPVLGCGCLLVLVVAFLWVGSQSEQAPTTPQQARPAAPSAAPRSSVRNADLANASDVRQAEQLLRGLPPACAESSAAASADGTVTIRVICSGAGKSMDGLVRIKNGIVTEIR